MHTKSLLEHEEPAPINPGPSRTFRDLISHSITTDNVEYETWTKKFRNFTSGFKISDKKFFLFIHMLEYSIKQFYKKILK